MKPSTSGDIGSGVIDATIDNTFSAVIKGDSPVVAYRVGIFKNNTTSDLIYSSGVIQLDEPFYGTLPNGKVVPFTYVVPSTSGITNGYTYGYKYILTLWWELDTSNYDTGCVQSFESVFYARSSPTLSIAQISAETNGEGIPVVGSKSHTFTGQYYQSNNVSLAWFKWTLANKLNTESPLAVVGPVYSCPKIEFEYDGLMSGTDYCVKVEARTQDGIEITSGWVDFTVSYDTIAIQSAVETRQTKENGILIDFGNIKYIEGIPSSDSWRFIKPCPYEEHICVEIDSGTNIVFTNSEHFDVDIPIDGEIVASFHLDEDNDDILYAEGTDDEGNNYYIQLSYSGHTDGLMPSTELTPSGELVPSAGTRGHFILNVNGVEYIKETKIPLPIAWFVVCVQSSGLAIYETNIVLDRSSMTVIEGATYGH